MQFMSKLTNSPDIESNRIFFMNVFLFMHRTSIMFSIHCECFPHCSLKHFCGCCFKSYTMPFLDLHHLAVDCC